MRRLIIAVLVAGVFAVLGTGMATGHVAGAQQTPDITIDPGSLDFGEQVAQQASRPLRVTITNTGSANLYINSVVLGGDNAADFAISNDACTDSTIPAGKSCILDVMMTPKETGPRAAVVTITCNAPGSTRTIELSGTGINSAAVPPQ